GLLAILPDRLAVRHRAVAAMARAHVAQDHEGRGGLFPALADVRTTRLLADRVQVPLAEAALEAHIIRSAGGPDLEPRRLLARDRKTVGLDHRKGVQHRQSLCSCL